MYYIICIILGILIGYLRRGSLASLFSQAYKNWFFGLIGVILEIILHFIYLFNALSFLLPYAAIINFIAYILIFITLTSNLNDIYTIVLALGVTFNFIVTFINAGYMPVSSSIIDSMPLYSRMVETITGGTNPIYTELIPGQSLLGFLAVIFPIPILTRYVVLTGTVAGVSIGSILTLVSLTGFIQSMMARGRSQNETILLSTDVAPVQNQPQFDSKTEELFFEETELPKDPLDRMFEEEDEDLTLSTVSPIIEFTEPGEEEEDLKSFEEITSPIPIFKEDIIVSEAEPIFEEDLDVSEAEPIFEEDSDVSEAESIFEEDLIVLEPEPLVETIPSKPLQEETIEVQTETEEDQIENEEIQVETQVIQVEPEVAQIEAQEEEVIESTDEWFGREPRDFTELSYQSPNQPLKREEPRENKKLSENFMEDLSQFVSQVERRMSSQTSLKPVIDGVLEETRENPIPPKQTQPLQGIDLELLNALKKSNAKNPLEDTALINAIMNSPKNRAEEIINMMRENLSKDRSLVQVDKKSGYYISKTYIKEKEAMYKEEDMMSVWSQLSQETQEKKNRRRRQTTETFQNTNPYQESQQKKLEARQAQNNHFRETYPDAASGEFESPEELSYEEERRRAGYEQVDFNIRDKTISIWRRKVE